MSKPTAPVSAVIPAYNAEAFIAETIESVRAQTLPVAEILVVDDGSTDQTAEIARKMEVRVISQSNAGLSAARNRCVRESSQPWIAFIDSDDVWEPEKIARQMQIAECDPEIALVTCDYSIFDRDGVITPSVLARYAASYEVQPKTKCAGGSIVERLHESFCDIPYLLVPSFVMVRRDVLEETGLFDETLFTAEDFECYMRALANRKFAVVESVSARRREHTANMSRHYTRASLSYLAATFKVLENPERYPEATVRLCRDWLPGNLRHAGARLIGDGDGQKGRDLLMQSARLKFSWRTMLALAASLAPQRIGRELMKARFYVGNNLRV